MPGTPAPLDLEDIVIAVYSALDDALAAAGVESRGGKLVPRPGPEPDVDDREILCQAMLQELLGFESDNAFHLWFKANSTMRSLFPRGLSRQNWADRRALLTPILQRLCSAFVALDEGSPPFSSWTRIRSTCADRCGRERRSGWEDWRERDIARRSSVGSTASGNI